MWTFQNLLPLHPKSCILAEACGTQKHVYTTHKNVKLMLEAFKLSHLVAYSDTYFCSYHQCL